MLTWHSALINGELQKQREHTIYKFSFGEQIFNERNFSAFIVLCHVSDMTIRPAWTLAIIQDFADQAYDNLIKRCRVGKEDGSLICSFRYWDDGMQYPQWKEYLSLSISLSGKGILVYTYPSNYSKEDTHRETWIDGYYYCLYSGRVRYFGSEGFRDSKRRMYCSYFPIGPLS